MRKLIYIAFAILVGVSAMSCTTKKYVVIENNVSVEDNIGDINGTIYDVRIHCYVENERAEVLIIDAVKPKTKTEKILLPPRTTKVRVAFQLAPESFFEKIGIDSRVFQRELVGYRFIDSKITTIVFDDNSAVID